MPRLIYDEKIKWLKYAISEETNNERKTQDHGGYVGRRGATGRVARPGGDWVLPDGGAVRKLFIGLVGLPGAVLAVDFVFFAFTGECYFPARSLSQAVSQVLAACGSLGLAAWIWSREE
jgi:hypothetical protein